MINFVKWSLCNGGSIIPLNLPWDETKKTGLCNPSILVDGNELIVNLRHVNYILYHSSFPVKWGNQYSCLCYLHPENDCILKTTNYICSLNKKTFEIENSKLIDTSKLDSTPLWNFVGLEDVRLVKWENKIYVCGVRRDTKTDGEGRIEISEIKENHEISRTRIEPPTSSYCEKNWMPILDMPFCFVKWTNPTEVVKVCLKEKKAETICLMPQSLISIKKDLRGSSQVITWGDFRVAIVHETDFWYTPNKTKNARYWHRFVVWDKNWNIVTVSEEFNFLDGAVEFCCGLAIYKEELLISFAFYDNTSYLLKIPLIKIKQFLTL